jgi:NitT/TauT family transport system ATP-binding protein
MGKCSGLTVGRNRGWTQVHADRRCLSARSCSGCPYGGVLSYDIYMTEPAPVISLKGISKAFDAPGRAQTLALEGIDLDIAPGEFVSLISPSGCGKSTLLRIVGDLVAPTTGAVLVNGKSARQARLDRDYGMVFQTPTLFEWRTIQGNVELPLEVMKIDRAERARRAAKMLDLVELSGFAQHYPWQLSGGMQQRVSIARALSFDPALLLMDEPFGALDEMGRERMNVELLKIWALTRTTVLFVTHSIPEAVFLSTRVVVMSARPGRVARIITIDLPSRRGVDTPELPRYFELITEVRASLRGLNLH